MSMGLWRDGRGTYVAHFSGKVAVGGKTLEQTSSGSGTDRDGGDLGGSGTTRCRSCQLNYRRNR
jgi:hypothetical protein